MRRIRRSAGAVLPSVPDLPSTDALCAHSGRTMEMPVAKTRARAKAGTFLFYRPGGLDLSSNLRMLHASLSLGVDADSAVV